MGIFGVRLGQAPLRILGSLDRFDVLVRKRESLGHSAIAQSTANLEVKGGAILDSLPLELEPNRKNIDKNIGGKCICSEFESTGARNKVWDNLIFWSVRFGMASSVVLTSLAKRLILAFLKISAILILGGNLGKEFSLAPLDPESGEFGSSSGTTIVSWTSKAFEALANFKASSWLAIRANFKDMVEDTDEISLHPRSDEAVVEDREPEMSGISARLAGLPLSCDCGQTNQ